MSLTHFSLFTGIGGIDLASEWAGFETVGQCEFADYPTKVLEKHWPHIPRWRDIRDVSADYFRLRTGLVSPTLISGGFPCQPFSVAGKQKGKRDDRYLWPEMLRVIQELAPRWVVCENVPGILRIAGKTVCEDLERAGYDVTVFSFEAAAVGAPHRRERLFFVSNTNSQRLETCGHEPKHEAFYGEIRVKHKDCNVSDPDNERRTLRWDRKFSTAAETSGYPNNNRSRTPEYVPGQWWATEPGVGRVANGVPSRVDRLKCLGNAVVPQQVYPILKAIAEIEKEVANEK